MISGISDEKQKEYYDTYNKLSNDLKSSVDDMLEELKNNQKSVGISWHFFDT